MNLNPEQIRLSPAVILLAHGSADPAWAAPLQALRERLASAEPRRPLRLAYLESASPTLLEAARDLAASGAHEVAVIPVFFSSGGPHLRRDVPALVAEAQRECPDLTLELLGGALGEEREVLDSMARAARRRLHRWPSD
ncbi:MAG TPA: CbiX/SirB N-terminal domain-containing protein [Candidatus Saccharimonadales bacterium]|nr:CbiX/SirB N-terminal domain-containing protein [Candidatus Saccharimonadales bacterium]